MTWGSTPECGGCGMFPCRHTARFLILWLLLLPLALWHLCGWGSVAATAVISFVLLGIEEIGVQIEVRPTHWKCRDG